MCSQKCGGIGRKPARRSQSRFGARFCRTPLLLCLCDPGTFHNAVPYFLDDLKEKKFNCFCFVVDVCEPLFGWTLKCNIRKKVTDDNDIHSL